MKKFLAFCLALAMLVSVVALASCKKRENYVVDTYKGSASRYSYESKDDTVQAYLENELSGETTTAVLVDYSVERELAQTEIDGLNVTDEDKVGLVKVEEVKIEYTEQRNSSVRALASSNANTKYRVMLVFTYENGAFKYYVKAIEVGETLTTSYMDSVFDTENYVNCTMKSDMNVNMSLKNGGMSVSAEMSTTGEYKISESAVYMSMKIDMGGIDQGGDISVPQKIEMYAWNSDDGLCAAANTGEGWQGSATAQWNSIADFVRYSLEGSFGAYDATFFVKTADGYELQSGKAKEWFADYADKIGSAGDIASNLDLLNNFKVSYKVSIRDGKVSKLSISCSYSVSQSGQAVSVTVTGSTTISNFGSTTVTVPQEVRSTVN